MYPTHAPFVALKTFAEAELNTKTKMPTYVNLRVGPQSDSMISLSWVATTDLLKIAIILISAPLKFRTYLFKLTIFEYTLCECEYFVAYTDTFLVVNQTEAFDYSSSVHISLITK